MVNFDKLQVGQILHDYHKYKMGNTRMRKEGHWTLTVFEIDTVKRMALCSWNGNDPRWYSEKGLNKFRTKEKKAKVKNG
jgi:hypothetical protein